MAEDIRKEEEGTQRPNELSWSSDPKHVPGQQPSDASRPGNPDMSDDDDETIREPNTGADEDDDTMKRGGMGRDRDTDPGEPSEGGIGDSGGYENR